ncbi:UNVERIFIED_CONTAM: hypothetical protein PYX00_008751 [Menopon gallinae]|uniref:Alpha-carbonic anhydrase domain-containing protein n=1 Tax=Menopon gallinae TaxID=328185 RepID=A0AAW2HPC5_9NEOP
MCSSLQFFVPLGLLVALAAGAYNSRPEFGYRGMNGPDHWVDVLEYGTCAGKLQSPIDIQEHLLVPVRFPPLTFRGFHSFPDSSVLTNNGHTVMLEMKTREFAAVSGGPLNGEYVFSQLHFHWGANDSLGSEDRINNHSFPMELHMVFYKLEYGDVPTAMRFKDGLAVFAVFYEVSDFDNMVYSEIVQHLDKVTQPHSKVQLLTPLTLDSLLPSNKYHYYTYNGSLTTPPCSEVVIWLDFKEPIFLSRGQVSRSPHYSSLIY